MGETEYSRRFGASADAHGREQDDKAADILATPRLLAEALTDYLRDAEGAMAELADICTLAQHRNPDAIPLLRMFAEAAAMQCARDWLPARWRYRFPTSTGVPK